MQAPTRSGRCASRLCTAVLLLPILGAAWLLITHVPVGRNTQQIELAQWEVRDNWVVRSEELWGQPCTIGVNWKTGATNVRSQAGDLDRIRPHQSYSNSRGDAVYVEYQAGTAEYSVQVIGTSGDVVFDKLLALPRYPVLVGDDYLICAEGRRFFIANVRTGDEQNSVPCSLRGDDSVVAVDQTNRFVSVAVIKNRSVADCTRS